MVERGKLITFEGTDGCGKATQVARLIDHASKKNLNVKKYDFPVYETDFGKLIKEYWTGKDANGNSGMFGKPTKYVPGTSTLLNALDQIQFADSIKNDLESGVTIISDRYWHSNLGYDGARHPPERNKRGRFYAWCEEVFRPMPKPDHIFFLDVPVERSAELLRQRAKEQGRELDFNEQRMDYQRQVQNCYKEYFHSERNWSRIVCAPEGVLRSREDIHNEIATIFDDIIRD